MAKEIIHTGAAPSAIGAYSQAVKCGGMVYISGQIPLDPQTMNLVNATIEEEIHQVFKNLAAIAQAAGSSLKHAAKVTIYLTDLTHFPKVNEIMAVYFEKPYPARATVQVSALPKGARVEADAVLVA
ncbi:MAG TPA: RidA family protein [Solimonas sp.]|nr:RidA family protein [Solimonas sp.]